MEPTAIAAALARRFEGLYLTPYLCPAGVPTIGYGATYYEDGTPVTLKDPAITRERAEELLLWMIKTVYAPAVMRLFPNADQLSPGLVAALIDFAFNLGHGALRNSTLRRKIIAGLLDEVPGEFRKWVKAGGKTLRGLLLRREAEILASGLPGQHQGLSRPRSGLLGPIPWAAGARKSGPQAALDPKSED